MENIKKSLLLSASCTALVVIALTFATGAGMIDPWCEEFSLTAEQVGWIIGTAFWGFTLGIVLICPVFDKKLKTTLEPYKLISMLESWNRTTTN